MTESHHRPIRSYVRRLGRMTKAQQGAFETLWQHYGIELADHDAEISKHELLDFEKVFHRQAPVILEIGFGMGEALLQLAQTHPENDFIGIDVHKPGAGAVLMGINKLGLSNVRLFNADAIDVLNKRIPDESLDGVHLFFPDPWPKQRHHKRRLVQANFVELIRTKLKLMGYLHMATDWEDYAEQMLAVMNSAEEFINSAGFGNYAPRPASRPLTRFEKRGEKLGHPVWDLIFIRRV